jgi:hypothetical protein
MRGGSPVQLAALRVAIAAALLLLPEVRDAPALASAPAVLKVAPEGLGWFVHLVPAGRGFATAMQAAYVASALCALVGLRARPALGVLGVSGFYVLALGQLSGAVWHDMHLLWMVALLAASPCDEALAFDRRGAPRPADGPRYGVPLFFARLLLACVYFFPGLHKLTTSGLAWALSDNVRNQLWWKWAEYGALPPLRIDQHPVLLRVAGLGVMAFELSFPVLALTRRGRPWAAISGLLFHALTQAFFGIPFASLWMLYVAFVDPERAVAWLRRRKDEPRDPPGPASPWTWVTGGVLVAAVAVQGLRGQTRAFPFACYPTFEWIAGTEMPDLILEAEMPDGTRAPVPNGRRSQRQWGEIWSLAGATSPPDPARLRAYLESLRRREPARSMLRGAVVARFYRGYTSVVPEDLGQPPRRGALLAEIRLSGGEGNSALQ